MKESKNWKQRTNNFLHQVLQHLEGYQDNQNKGIKKIYTERNGKIMNEEMEKMIEQIDENNMKALAVLNNMLAVFKHDPDSKMDVPNLLEVIHGFINANNEIFNEMV